MNIFDAVFQGTVQGLTEFLPVSSSGHLVLSQHILGIQENNLFFDVMLHVGTLIAVIGFYHKKILKLIKAFFKVLGMIFEGNFKVSKLRGDNNMVFMLIVGLIPLFFLFVPVVPGVKNVKDVAEELSGGNYIIITGISLLVTSFILHRGIKINRFSDRIRKFKGGDKENYTKNRINIYDALNIGFAQFVAAVFPGLSRSGSTLSVGLMRGLNRQTALDYSFILGIPAIIAAAILEFKEAMETGALNNINYLAVIAGVVTSAVVGFASIKLLKWLLEKDKMMGFIIYTLVLGAITVIIGIIEMINGVNIFTGVPI